MNALTSSGVNPDLPDDDWTIASQVFRRALRELNGPPFGEESADEAANRLAGQPYGEELARRVGEILARVATKAARSVADETFDYVAGPADESDRSALDDDMREVVRARIDADMRRS